MSKNILEQFEKHVDKIVFGIIGILCLALLWFFVISNPYASEYKRKKFGPGQYDEQVRKEASRLEDKMDEDPVEAQSYKAKSGQYSQKLARSIESIDDNIYAVLPGVGDVAPVDDRSYDRPEIPDIEDVQAEWYRTVVHVPTDTIDLSNTYGKATTEYGDIDIVTVQGTFDMAKLMDNFTDSFNPSLGGMLAKYRSAELAEPLFAAVDLERRELGENGWGQWKVVPRSKVDAYEDHLSDIPSNMSEVEIGGVELILANYNSPEIQRAIVQPECYEFASSIDTWFPPVLHAEYLTVTKLQRDQERQDARRTERGRSARDRRTNPAGMLGGEMMTGTARTRERRERTTARRGPRTVDDISSDYNKILLKDNTQLANYKKPLVVWAHDDTVEPEKTYRYRMRIGVFNPTAGKGWFHGSDKNYADEVILWSEYIDVTEEITIDPTIYFFPINLARNKQSVSIQVSRFAMGNWQSHEFDVTAGQLIGQAVEDKPEVNADDGEEMRFDEGIEIYGEKKEPKVVDYSTGAILVDIVEMSDWAGSSSLRERNYSDILYTSDGSNIKRLPTKKGNWPKDLQRKFDKIRVAQEIEVELLDRGTGVRRDYKVGPGMMPGMMPGMGPGMMPGMGPGMMPGDRRRQ